VSCAWAGIPEDVCQVQAEPFALDVPIFELGPEEIAVGPLSPPDLADFCASIGLSFYRVAR
jgi:hypothetical protein